MSDNELAARKAAADKYDSEWPLRTTMGNLSREGFLAGWDAACQRLTEDYYTLAEIRLAVDTSIVEYGSYAARLHGIADLIDKKRPELKPTSAVSAQAATGGSNEAP